jgi:hypothetical protein
VGTTNNVLCFFYEIDEERLGQFTLSLEKLEEEFIVDSGRGEKLVPAQGLLIGHRNGVN